MKSYLPAFIWALVITYLSTQGGLNLPQSIWDLVAADKFGHAFVYGVLVILFLIGNNKQGIKQSVINVSLVVIACILFGILLEFIQLWFYPNRFFETLDIIANIIGCILGYIVYKFIIIKFS